jgi:hypothetical protein
VDDSQLLGEVIRALTIIPLFVIPFRLLVMLATSSSGDQHFALPLRCTDHGPIGSGDERKWQVADSTEVT